MTEIRFYHLERSPLEQALPALLSKILSIGHTIIVKADTPQNAEALSGHLWAYDPNSFLPHGTTKDGHAEAQPIFITDKDENPNNADVLVQINGSESEDLSNFKICCDMFDGRNEAALNAARKRWKTLKDQDYTLTYWQQGNQGWEKKA